MAAVSTPQDRERRFLAQLRTTSPVTRVERELIDVQRRMIEVQQKRIAALQSIVRSLATLAGAPMPSIEDTK